ncbi:MAG: hypothetical protein ABJQ23_01070 [Shimia thalassica]|uniref:hypothetical protein n=1 Tax=Shimia thalassica TaxID=1715693 RepID=UPI00329931D4
MLSFKQDQTVGDWLGATQSASDNKIIMVVPADFSVDAVEDAGEQNGGFSVNEPGATFLEQLASSIADMTEQPQITSLVQIGEPTLPDHAWFGAERIQQESMIQSICTSLANIVFPQAGSNQHSVMLCRNSTISEKDMQTFLDGWLLAFPTAKLVVADTKENKLAVEALFGSLRRAGPERVFFWEITSGDDKQAASEQLNKFLTVN